MRRSLLFAAIAALVLAVAAPAMAQSTGAQVTVIHGVPGLTVDVYVNGDLTLEGFEPGTVTDPLSLPAGDYEIEIYAAGADPSVDSPAIAQTVPVSDGVDATVMAHLDASANPTLGVFVNDTSPIPAGQARLTVRHTAAAPAVDVRANGEVAFPNLENPNEASADLPAGTISADVVLAGTDTVAIGPADLTLEAGTAYLVYAWGSADDGNLDLIVQTIGGLAAPADDAPTAVPSGSGGLATDAGFPIWIAALSAAFLAVAIGGGVALTRARRTH